MIKKPESRDEKEDRHGKPGYDLKQRHQVNVWRRIRQILRANVDTDDPEHRDATYIFDGVEVRLVHGRRDPLSRQGGILPGRQPSVSTCRPRWGLRLMRQHWPSDVPWDRGA